MVDKSSKQTWQSSGPNSNRKEVLANLAGKISRQIWQIWAMGKQKLYAIVQKMSRNHSSEPTNDNKSEQKQTNHKREYRSQRPKKNKATSKHDR